MQLMSINRKKGRVETYQNLIKAHQSNRGVVYWQKFAELCPVVMYVIQYDNTLSSQVASDNFIICSVPVVNVNFS